jgi:hypothetical protein
MTFLNVYFMKRRVKPYITENPSLQDGYNKIFKAMLTWGNLPWVVMGYGILTNNVATMFHFFRPQDQNPYVLAWFASIFLIYLLLLYWVFFKNGAEILIKYRGVFNQDFKSVILIKGMVLLTIVVGVVATVAMYSMDIPLDTLKL